METVITKKKKWVRGGKILNFHLENLEIEKANEFSSGLPIVLGYEIASIIIRQILFLFFIFEFKVLFIIQFTVYSCFQNFFFFLVFP